MKMLIIFNQEPYNGTDVTWNGLRLAKTLREKGNEVRIFLMNDSVDMARDAFIKITLILREQKNRLWANWLIGSWIAIKF